MSPLLPRLHVHQQWLVLLLATTTAAAFDTCYYPDGTIANGYQPCSNDDVANCCPGGSVCISNGLCIKDDSVIRGTCTDRNWPDECLDYCMDTEDSGAMMHQCSTVKNSFCCQAPGDKDLSDHCCSTSSLVFTVPAGMPTLTIAARGTFISVDSAAETTVFFTTFPEGASTGSATAQSTSAPSRSATGSKVAAAAAQATSSKPSATSFSSSDSKSNAVAIGAGLGVGIPVGLGIIGGLAFLFFRRRRQQNQKKALGEKPELSPYNYPSEFSQTCTPEPEESLSFAHDQQGPAEFSGQNVPTRLNMKGTSYSEQTAQELVTVKHSPVEMGSVRPAVELDNHYFGSR